MSKKKRVSLSIPPNELVKHVLLSSQGMKNSAPKHGIIKINKNALEEELNEHLDS
jgi:hypothetical protein